MNVDAAIDRTAGDPADDADEQEEFVTLTTSDGTVRRVPIRIAYACKTIKALSLANLKSGVVSLETVDSQTLDKVIEYIELLFEKEGEPMDADEEDGDDNSDDDEKKIPPLTEEQVTNPKVDFQPTVWQQEFLQTIGDAKLLTDTLKAANFLNFRNLCDLMATKIASDVYGKTPKEVRELYNLPTDFLPERPEKLEQQT